MSKSRSDAPGDPKRLFPSPNIQADSASEAELTLDGSDDFLTLQLVHHMLVQKRVDSATTCSVEYFVGMIPRPIIYINSCFYKFTVPQHARPAPFTALFGPCTTAVDKEIMGG
jgi:hypothetical protein